MVKKVLIVEDDPDYQQHAKLKLEKCGYQVYQATTENEGYKLAAQHKPGVIILDYQLLGGGNGGNLAQRLRDNDVTTGAYILGWGSFPTRKNLDVYKPKVDVISSEGPTICELVAEGFK